jgi:hypothetical protein
VAGDITVPTAPPLSRVSNVELMHTGTWPISTGVFTFTTDDLYQAVAALDCPAVRRPILKLGHVDPRFDGEPAVGYIDHMAVADGGRTLVGDYAGMPGWLGPVIASAYPDRSIEGEYDFRCQMGHTHPFVLTGLALLGVAAPGIGTLESLQDVAQLYGVEVAAAAPNHPAQQQGGGQPVVVNVHATQEAHVPNPNPRTVAASVTSEDVIRSFYASPLGQSWDAWVTELQLDPLQVIYCDDATGDSYRVPVTVDAGKDGTDAVSFETPIKVVLRYDDAAAPVAAAAGREPIRFASREESRPGQRPAAGGPTTSPAEPADGNTPTPTMEVIVADASSTTLSEGLRSRLGVTDADADDAVLLAALDEALTERTSPTGEPAPLPEGTVAIDSGVLQELQVAARAGQEARARQIREDRDVAIRAAITDGRITPARREHWEQAFAADPEGARASLETLAKGLVPVAAAGAPGGSDVSEDDAVFASLFGEQKAAV